MSAAVTHVLPVLAALSLMLLNGMVLVCMSRNLLAAVHFRAGPLQACPKGLVQVTADVLKLLSKEGIAPAGADRWMYVLAPAVVFVPSLMAFAALPFSDTLRITRLETGLLFTVAVLSIVPLGIAMAGWASAGERSPIAAMRAVAHKGVYELPLLLSVLPAVMISGTLDLGHIVNYQTGLWLGVVPKWFALPLLPSLLIFAIAALCGLNRTSFDASGRECEPMPDHATEYSSMKFGLFLLSDFSRSFVVSALAVTVFFGGWTLPFVPEDLLAPIAPVVFLVKTYVLILVFVSVRGVLPGVRMDQLMDLGWKWLVPLSMAWIMIVGLVVKLSAAGGVG